MLSLARGVSKRSNVLKPLSRGFAQEVSTPIPASEVQRPEANAASNSANAWRRGKIPVREDHGLYAFFRRKKGTEATGEDAYETVESPKTAVSGRAWRAAELRLKSFKDLHTLWYVTLRERNLLASQKEEARKAGIKVGLTAQTTMAGHCRKTMARIKVVMNERRLAYNGAVKLFAEHQDLVQDKQLVKMQEEARKQAEEEYAKLQEKIKESATKGRMNQRKRRQEIRLAKEKAAESAAAGAFAEGASADAAAAAEAASTNAAPASSTSTSAAPEKAEVAQSPVDTATAGSSGAPTESKQ